MFLPGPFIAAGFAACAAAVAVVDELPFRWSARISWLIVIGFALVFIGALLLD